jgi:hypothetical protein
MQSKFAENKPLFGYRFWKNQNRFGIGRRGDENSFYLSKHGQ